MSSAEYPLVHIPPTARGHFAIHLYAAIYHLLDYVRRLSEIGGPKLDQLFTRYPFLAGYFAEMRRYMPEEVIWGEGGAWWRTAIATWEIDCPSTLPLQALTLEAGIDLSRRIALMTVCLVEVDSRFGTVFAELQEPLGQRRPTLELVGQLVFAGDRPAMVDAWAACQPLLHIGLIEALNPAAPRSEWLLRMPSLLWDAIRDELAGQLYSGLRYHPPTVFPQLEELIYPAGFHQRLANIPALLESRKARTLILRSDPGADPLEVIGALARRLGRGVLAVDHWEMGDEVQRRPIGPLCTMSRSLPAFSCDLGPGETIDLPPLTGYEGPVGVLLGHEGGLGTSSAKQVLTLSLPPLDHGLRLRYWQQALNGQQLEDPDAVAERFHLSGAYLRQAAGMAVVQAGLNGRETVSLLDIREACGALNRQLLDTLAKPLESCGTWSDLVVAESTLAKLRELERRCHHRERLLDRLGPAFGNNANRGVRALFTGVSGTGKTLAAKILAAELGMDLYRVDLAAVINKYIGETEKNLHRVLSHAEALDVILLLDEGDALLGSRTEVKSANDRYANLETNYLLQRLENYQGIVVVTTNLAENVDRAFQRRMDVVVPFFASQPEERWQILQLHLPTDHVVDASYLEQVALRCALTGGQLRNAALHAALLALEEDSPVQRQHLDKALRSEYRKAGGIFPMNNGHAIPTNWDGGLDAFIAALQATQC